MASEKAKENKTLTAQCAGCGKTLSPEIMQSMVIEHGHRREAVPVCDTCRQKGWKPEGTAS